jgi:hypothetical protein
MGERKAGAEPRRAARITELENWRPLLVKYCQQKLDAEDWHGVQDAASDLRDLDNELDGLKF